MASNDYVTEAESRQTKKQMKAPCVYVAWNDMLNKDTDFYPAVNCSYDCAHCGWNPEVKQKRVEKIVAELEAERAKQKKRKKVKG